MFGRQATRTRPRDGRTRRRMIAAALTLLVGAPGDALAADDDTALLSAYAPVFHIQAPSTPCAEGNGHLPLAVDPVLDSRDVTLRGPDGRLARAPGAAGLARADSASSLDLAGTPTRGGCTERRWEAALVAAGARRTIYGRVVRDPDSPRSLFVQYWYFLVTDDSVFPHEGDWEMVQIEFATPDAAAAIDTGPVTVSYAHHEIAETLEWRDVPRQSGTHPEVWPAPGSNVPEPAAAVFLTTADGCDDTSGANTVAMYAVTTIPSDDATARSRYPWLAFTGRWGTRADGAGAGPIGPALREQWTAPWRWSRSHSRAGVRVPSRGAVAAVAADGLCSAVALGARSLRTVSTLPTVSRAAFGAGIALLVLLAVLWGWRALRRSDARSAMVAGAALVTTGLGLVCGAIQWVGELLAVGSFAAITDTVAVALAVLLPVATFLLLVAAAVTGAAGRGDAPATSALALALRHPLRTWSGSAAHSGAGARMVLVATGVLTALIARAGAIAALLELGWPFWTAMPIASLFDAVLMGSALSAVAAAQQVGADRAAAVS